MNRRKFIKTGIIAGSVSVLGFGGFEYYSLFRKPDYGYLDKKERLIEALCETMIPKTETPGAAEAGAHHFVTYAVKNILNRKEANTFIEGLKDIESFCSFHFELPYTECTNVQKIKAIQSSSVFRIKRNHPLLLKASNKVIGRSFEDLLRDLTAIGFCTSEKGATLALAYDPIPVDYFGCIPLAKGQRSWATK